MTTYEFSRKRLEEHGNPFDEGCCSNYINVALNRERHLIANKNYNFRLFDNNQKTVFRGVTASVIFDRHNAFDSSTQSPSKKTHSSLSELCELENQFKVGKNATG